MRPGLSFLKLILNGIFFMLHAWKEEIVTNMNVKPKTHLLLNYKNRTKTKRGIKKKHTCFTSSPIWGESNLILFTTSRESCYLRREGKS